MRKWKPYIDKRFEKIVTMCQKAREKYWFNYEEKYKNKIERFVKEIERDWLLDKCEAKTFAEQLCVANGLEQVLELYKEI